MRALLIVFFCALTLIFGQNITSPSTYLHNGLTERIGNFSIELLYHTSKSQQKSQNLIISPITVWTVLAVISESAGGETALQINNALRISAKHKNYTRNGFQSIFEWLKVNTSTIELANINLAFLDSRKQLQIDFQYLAETIYNVKVIPVDVTNGPKVANDINQAISDFTRGRIPNLIDSSSFNDVPMLLTSALYFKGQWAVPFNASQTTKMPFYNSTGQKIGEVNMMYNRFTYPFSNIKELQARVIELSYGKEDRLSMLIMLPHPGVSLENMFLNFAKVPLDTIFKELRLSKEEYSDDEVDCFLPRFKIKSELDLTDVLKNSMGIADLFDESAARLPFLSRKPLYVSKVVHKAEIEVTEEGTTATAVTSAEFSNRIGIVSFVGNRPFCYLIIEKVTNSIVFGGLYEEPSLY